MTEQVHIIMNDREFDVVARNAILLLLALTSHESTGGERPFLPSNVAEALIHVWYSTSIPSETLSQLQDRVKPLIVEACNKISDRSPEVILGEIWKFSGGQALRLVLKKEEWFRLLKFFAAPDDVTREEAE
jgi:hypothetical protein